MPSSFSCSSPESHKHRRRRPLRFRQTGSSPSVSLWAPKGVLQYRVAFNGQEVIKASRLGLELQNQQPLGSGMKIASSRPGGADKSYRMPHGKANPVRNHYRSVVVDLVDGRVLPTRRPQSRGASPAHRLSRGVQADRPPSGVPERPYARGGHGPRVPQVECSGHARPQRHDSLHPNARRADGLHAWGLQQRYICRVSAARP
ncbi:MAG: hypothetical protein EHM23_02485 [Acidobacteria bacterium]|nr:MAG: hypothetical protein EHM23_02485 [Acidobacteriota bacterium]